MILTCPACSAKYTVPADAIPSDGRQVRCSDCKHTWKQMPLDKVADLSGITPPPKGVKALPAGGNLPAVRRVPVSATTKYNTAAMLMVAALFGFLTYQPQLEAKLPFTKAIYGILKLDNSSDIAFRDISATFTREDNRLKMSFQGLLANESANEKKNIQPMNVSVLSEGGNVMGSVPYMPDTKVLEPGEEIAINSTLGGLSGNAKTVVLEYGNWLEKLFY